MKTRPRTELVVWWLRGNSRSQIIARALQKGGRQVGYRAIIRSEGQFDGVRGDVAAFYGYQKNMPVIMKEYLKAGKKVVFVDLGYWLRRHGGRFTGFHKVAIDGRHPTPEFLDRPRPAYRFAACKVQIKPYRKKGNHIILAGMSEKSAASYGLGAQEWERWAITEMRKHTHRRIIYRPKPSWRGARPIAGSDFMHDGNPIEPLLASAHAVVTHHSNVAIDALCAGVPTFCWDGAATGHSLQELARIEDPWLAPDREKLMTSLAHAQWSVSEMSNGAMWNFLRTEGWLP